MLASRVPAEVAAPDSKGRIWGTDFGTHFLSPIFAVPNEDGFLSAEFPLFLRDVPDHVLATLWQTKTMADSGLMAICERLWSPCPELD